MFKNVINEEIINLAVVYINNQRDEILNTRLGGGASAYTCSSNLLLYNYLNKDDLVKLHSWKGYEEISMMRGDIEIKCGAVEVRLSPRYASIHEHNQSVMVNVPLQDFIKFSELQRCKIKMTNANNLG